MSSYGYRLACAKTAGLKLIRFRDFYGNYTAQLPADYRPQVATFGQVYNFADNYTSLVQIDTSGNVTVKDNDASKMFSGFVIYT